ncbi:hypothetical protein KHO49_17675 [Pseudomonas sp. RC4D1]|uniref:hypothetical protein n=1 Tax=Pseudomonas sp. RC4D1 TaxID=2834407 RepID=UPI001BCC918D|nr:hypothetical protein [Pseudomonas sp. RC4D1]MBS7560172.1 hypothetical protein [Pseudomonas sp. RC4D1]
MTVGWQRLIRSSARALLWGLVALTFAVLANVLGIQMLGSIPAWKLWLDQQAPWLVAWRLILYIGTAYGWCWMRRRLLAREHGAASSRRLMRAEIAIAVTVIALEGSQLLSLG